MDTEAEVHLVILTAVLIALSAIGILWLHFGR